jgi:hypothetical protein
MEVTGSLHKLNLVDAYLSSVCLPFVENCVARRNAIIDKQLEPLRNHSGQMGFPHHRPFSLIGRKKYLWEGSTYIDRLVITILLCNQKPERSG